MTPQDQNRLNLLEARLRDLDQRLRAVPSQFGKEEGFWAKITAATSVADNRWKYDWEEVAWGMSGGILTYSTPADARVGPYTGDGGIGDTGWAWNTTEMNNTATDAGAGWSFETVTAFGTADPSGDLVTATWERRPVNPIGQTNTGALVYPILWLRPTYIPQTKHTAYLFAGWNTLIGGGS